MAKNKAIERIKSYLDERAEKDELFGQMYMKENKNLEGCFGYIVARPRKPVMGGYYDHWDVRKEMSLKQQFRGYADPYNINVY